MMFISKEDAVKLVLLMYEGESCRICGETITDATDAVYAGYSHDNKSRSAHKACWSLGKPKSDWTFPFDSE